MSVVEKFKCPFPGCKDYAPNYEDLYEHMVQAHNAQSAKPERE